MASAHPVSVGLGRDEREASRLHLNALDVVDEISSLVKLDELISVLDRTFRNFAVEHFVITGLPSPHERFERVIILRHWPEEWFATYVRADFVRVDPVIRMCRRTVSPFEWAEAPFDSTREPGAAQVMNLAGDMGLKRGFTIPVHGLHGFEACFSLSGRDPDFDRRTKPALHLIAMYAFEQAQKLAARVHTEELNPLTAREREVLTWAAVGKTHADIAEILSVTERTVTAHTVNATHKLGAANKTQAVVRAMQSNYIRI